MTGQTMPPQIASAAERLRSDPRATFAALDAAFRSGSAVAPDGRYSGSLVVMQPRTAMERFAGFMSRYWMPWRGKVFDAADATGDNLLDPRLRWSVRAFFPRYRGLRSDTQQTGNLRGFRFRTRTERGLGEPDLDVVVLDYDLPENPDRVRAVRDEIVQLPGGEYLGRAHIVQRWAPTPEAWVAATVASNTPRAPADWYTVAYFALVRGDQGG